ncbi:RIKEN cDNA D630029K05, isoform CRA_a [Mus musculus]|nr:RIKEN cDNA D630029K05, isoform CRA_a [Mus musculus]EDL21820.1 RIKEN cDNA D630029K05, isoform CRA_a [Mus musculus]EDL21821.1 RIKEN cDNA D630029K05, isoform CRA_a [Mus musculus]
MVLHTEEVLRSCVMKFHLHDKAKETAQGKPRRAAECGMRSGGSCLIIRTSYSRGMLKMDSLCLARLCSF